MAAVDALVPRVLELTELLVDRLGVEDVGAHFPHRVAYHPTCHSLRALALGERPLTLLRAVGGIDLVQLPEADSAAASAGHSRSRTPIIGGDAVGQDPRGARYGAEVITAADNSCLMQIGGGLRRQRAGVRAMHIAEILASGAGRSAR